MGQLLHTLEDFSAHSNYIELCLIQLGHHQVFPHVGDSCFIVDPRGQQVRPLVTGTFGSSDFLFSLLGEAQDKISEASIDDLSAELTHAKKMDNNSRELMDLIGNVPGLGDDVSRDIDGLRSMDRSMGDPADMSTDQIRGKFQKKICCSFYIFWIRFVMANFDIT